MEKCIGSQREVRQGSRRSALGVKEKCVDFSCFLAEYPELQNVGNHANQVCVKFSELGQISSCVFPQIPFVVTVLQSFWVKSIGNAKQ